MYQCKCCLFVKQIFNKPEFVDLKIIFVQPSIRLLKIHYPSGVVLSSPRGFLVSNGSNISLVLHDVIWVKQGMKKYLWKCHVRPMKRHQLMKPKSHRENIQNILSKSLIPISS